MKRIAIDLTWVRHKKVGGTESYIRNLLDGFAELNIRENRFILLLAKDNADSFMHYKDYECFEFYICNVLSSNRVKRVLWQNLNMGSVLNACKIDLCLEPVYGKPYFSAKNVKYVTTIHDLQAIHYPQYFNKLRVAWMKAGWRNAVNTSEKIIAISNYVKNDIVEQYKVLSNKIKVIYNAVVIDENNCLNDSELIKFGIEKQKYYYTVSSLFLHKNIKTLILTIAELKRNKSNAFFPLVISGIGGKRDELDRLIKENGIEDDIIFTPFVEDQERNMLYKNCKAFLFSSIFEGFGMPPIEAMALNVPVVTTRCTSLEEVTGGLLNYVEEPLNPEKWIEVLEGNLRIPNSFLKENLLKKYDRRVIAMKYIDLFNCITDQNVSID